MRRIERTTAFRRDFKREQRGRHRADLDSLVSDVISLLAEDRALPERNRDHPLAGEWKDHRECHLKPDLLLITASRVSTCFNLFVWARIANSSIDGLGYLNARFRMLK